MKATFVLHNFMRMAHEDQEGDLQLSAACQERGLLLGRMLHGCGPTTQHGRQSVCGRSSPPTSSKRVMFPDNTLFHRLHYAQPKALLRVIHIVIRIFFHLHVLSYVNCNYSIPCFSPFDFYVSGEGVVQVRVMSAHKQNRLF